MKCNDGDDVADDLTGATCSLDAGCNKQQVSEVVEFTMAFNFQHTALWMMRMLVINNLIPMPVA